MSTTTPSLQTRSQYNRDWGNFATIADVPNGSGNALANPYFSQLEVGDTAYVTGTSQKVVCTAVGSVSGSDAVWAAAGSSQVLWEWNRTDTSQFGASVDLGLGPNIAGLTLTTVAGGPDGTLLRVASTELDVGGVAWPILQALPRRYVIEIEYWLVQFSDVSNTGNNLGGVVVMADSTLDNVVAFASLNPTTEDELYLGNIAISSGVLFGPAFHLNGSPLGRFQGGPVATPTPTGMRLQYTVEMERPFSANPRATIRFAGSGYNDAITGAMATELYGNTAGISGIYPAAWNGLIADTAGLLAGNGGVTTAWSMDIFSMRILKHPADL